MGRGLLHVARIHVPSLTFSESQRERGNNRKIENEVKRSRIVTNLAESNYSTLVSLSSLSLFPVNIFTVETYLWV